MKAAKGHVFKYGDNVDTDVIIPARYLNSSDPKELATHCMEDIDKYFVKKVKAGDEACDGETARTYEELVTEFGKLPGGAAAFARRRVPQDIPVRRNAWRWCDMVLSRATAPGIWSGRCLARPSRWQPECRPR